MRARYVSSARSVTTIRVDAHTELQERAREQVVGQRSLRQHALEACGDGVRLPGPDPDGQVAVAVPLSEQDDVLGRIACTCTLSTYTSLTSGGHSGDATRASAGLLGGLGRPRRLGADEASSRSWAGARFGLLDDRRQSRAVQAVGVDQMTRAGGACDWPLGVDGWLTYMPRMSAMDGRAPRVDHWLR